MIGKILKTYRSGLEASKEIGIQQGDISLCCRGLKHAANGYRFRFVGDIDPEKAYKEAKALRKSLLQEAQALQDAQPELMRSRRATRVDQGGGEEPYGKGKAWLAPADMKARQWTKERVSVGGIMILKYLPKTPNVNAALQEFRPKKKRQR